MRVDQKIEALSEDDTRELERQRSWVRDHYDPGSKDRYDTLEGKLALMETILRNNWIEPNETWKLQSLGVTFGDALAQKLNLQWVAVEDEYGRDPALSDLGTTILLFPKTSISKRIEGGQTFDLRDLFEDACENVVRMRARLLRNDPR